MNIYSPRDFDILGTTLVKYNGNAAHVTVPAGVTVIGQLAFADKPTLRSVELPGTVTAIEYKAFLNCPALEYVVIPRSVTKLGQLLFLGSVQATIYTPEGSAAFRYAKDRSMRTKPKLPSTPGELGIPANWSPKDHPLFANCQNGRRHQLRGNILITVYLVTDSVSTWTERDAATYRKNYDQAIQDLEHAAFQHNIPLKIHTVYKYVKATTQCTLAYWKRWFARWGSHCPPGSAPGYDEKIVILALNKEMTSFAYQDISIIGTNGICFKNRTIRHELCHNFGAEDLYKPPKVSELADLYLPDSIMNSEGNNIDALTAYYIGWTDTLSPEALAFLWETRNVKL